MSRGDAIDMAVKNILGMWPASIFDVYAQVSIGFNRDFSFVWWVQRNFREIMGNNHG